MAGHTAVTLRLLKLKPQRMSMITVGLENSSMTIT